MNKNEVQKRVLQNDKPLEHRAFESLLQSKFPAINKNVLKEYQEKHSLLTIKDFLNIYGDLNDKTIMMLHSDIMKSLFVTIS